MYSDVLLSACSTTKFVRFPLDCDSGRSSHATLMLRELVLCAVMLSGGTEGTDKSKWVILLVLVIVTLMFELFNTC